MSTTVPQRKLSQSSQDKYFEQILSEHENKTCADCAAKGPMWTSIDFGVFICMNCAGQHRALTAKVTRVKSVKLDSWEIKLYYIMKNVGNLKANEFWEFKMPKNYKKPGLNATQQEIKKFVEDKYIKKLFAPQGFKTPVQEYLENQAKLAQNGNQEQWLQHIQQQQKRHSGHDIQKGMHMISAPPHHSNWNKFYDHNHMQDQTSIKNSVPTEASHNNGQNGIKPAADLLNINEDKNHEKSVENDQFSDFITSSHSATLSSVNHFSKEAEQSKHSHHYSSELNLLEDAPALKQTINTSNIMNLYSQTNNLRDQKQFQYEVKGQHIQANANTMAGHNVQTIHSNNQSHKSNYSALDFGGQQQQMLNLQQQLQMNQQHQHVQGFGYGHLNGQQNYPHTSLSQPQTQNSSAQTKHHLPQTLTSSHIQALYNKN